ncbi:(2S)-3-sulfopropanediol dehydratase activating enzyme [Telmatospirillum siberiense]|uniref:Glycyl-radical enzyme activating protein n=1 Tax=Telmatospirillum siberiense TaxID=382514 RepID=A0A2N3PUC6_9PROT|nr:glycyl-radical enzyme activating protein [Telmatospirillum siberiense]PKU24012.1 glycyl-radical enzyme activating protein [Telmatospirillum siberiense]
MDQPDREESGVVFNIQRYSVHDGQGIRTVVFLKGCPLRCRWCSNPESQGPHPELARNAGRCLGVEICDYCKEICANGALGLPEAGAPVVDRGICRDCMACAATCPAQAMQPYGSVRTARQVLDAVEKDSPFYSRSEGGMTLSGGEPLTQPAFALALLREAARRHVDCAMETCGHVSWTALSRACGLLRELFFDLKVMDPVKHKEQTGVDNRLITDNLRRLLTEFPRLAVRVRTPVIPGVNDSRDDIAAILDFIRPFPHVTYELLPYHRLGAQKYAFLDRDFPMGDARLDNRKFEELRNFAAGNRQAE